MPTQNQFHVRICLHFRFAQVLICGIRLYYIILYIPFQQVYDKIREKERPELRCGILI